MIFAGIPVKPFGVAKRRLYPLLDAGTRTRLGRDMARRTAEAAGAAGAHAAIVTGDDGVARWARGLGFDVVREPAPGLDNAAAATVDAAVARGLAWAVIHADLPLVQPSDLEEVFAAAAAGMVLAPARDGGTNVLAGNVAEFRFGYGPASFHRHLRRCAGMPVTVVVRTGSAVDVDRPADFTAAAAHRRGAWLREYLIL